MFRLCLLLVLISHALSSELCNPADKKALLQLKKDLNNPYLLASWNPATDCCDWYTVTCDPKTHRIVSLTILDSTARSNFSAQIPPSIANLPFLRSLEFHKLPNLTGPLQPAIARLTRLTFLRISWTNLSGPVPSFLAQLNSLTFLDLSFNNLSGTIPPSLSQLSGLAALHLDRNHLTGSIPESFGYFKSSPDLYLSHNNLSGQIPNSFINLNLTTIDLSRNKLEGDASMLFGSNKTVQIVDLSRNLLAFNVSKVVFPSSLTSLDLNHNKVYGSLPGGLTELNFQYLNVSYNRLCGQIPVGGKLQSFDVYSYFHNSCLCGSPLPACK
ncbi:polygalacturonase inhibitor-like [Neltuma alba]|uniref:polygalacturonase inhibitor-like n=1 Tax=Neltuma alba TaxID=207710 RepID=UPI0010A5883A|nr:polygalacturonase inhibitor-like [Prosopis alba]XP_028808691.1 polygalacturonase inhibitor-like [Prosopis alba]XP_028808729.1 polygalacturonase inhibitor-like [Prosopis alba]